MGEPAATESSLAGRNAAIVLTRTLDALDQELVLFDLHGELIHENRALASRLTEDDADAVRLRIKELACAIAARAWDSNQGQQARIRPLVRHVETSRRGVRLRGCYLGALPPGAESAVLVTVEPDHSRRQSPTALLQSRFDLTCQQARVALLLANRASNREIARQLGISPHTARHHTERVLVKLGVHSRETVGEMLRRE